MGAVEGARAGLFLQPLPAALLGPLPLVYTLSAQGEGKRVPASRPRGSQSHSLA